MSSADSPVFYDPAGRRWRRVRRTWLALAVVVTGWIAKRRSKVNRNCQNRQR